MDQGLKAYLGFQTSANASFQSVYQTGDVLNAEAFDNLARRNAPGNDCAFVSLFPGETKQNGCVIPACYAGLRYFTPSA